MIYLCSAVFLYANFLFFIFFFTILMSALCGSCASAFIASDNVFMTFCGHIFHEHCLLDWVDGFNSCPECRVICRPSEVRRLYLSMMTISLEEETYNNMVSEVIAINMKCREQSQQMVDLHQSTSQQLNYVAFLDGNIRDLQIKREAKLAELLNLRLQNDPKKDIEKRIADMKLFKWILNTEKISGITVEEILNRKLSSAKLLKMIWILKDLKKKAADEKQAIRIALRPCQKENKQLQSEIRSLEHKSQILEARNINLKQNILRAKNMALKPATAESDEK